MLLWTVTSIRVFVPNMVFLATPPSSGFLRDLWNPKSMRVPVQLKHLLSL
ncbi:hypothetical protein M8C21_033724 [Ambrosia artemisiifolia]|uniref:Uncharacterized protein n=1 Tax=Ambrosia artemisiifolia TaxID=4212 RepID=A0AAD5C260_AMBAR|nr:hypothetical protein M8C21_033724 [Ambrosia artemisiifolia]